MITHKILLLCLCLVSALLTLKVCPDQDIHCTWKHMFTNFLEEVKCDGETIDQIQRGFGVGRGLGLESHFIFVVESLLSSEKFVRPFSDVKWVISIM